MKAGWEVRPLGKIGTLQRGFDLPKAQRAEGQFPLVTSSGATDTHNVAKVKGPGVATGRSGSIGNVFYVEEDFWPLNTALYVKDFHGNDPRFVYYLLQLIDLGRFASGAGVPTLNRNDVHGELFAVPGTLEEQQRIVAVLDEAFEGLSLARANAEANLKNAKELFESFLDDVFRMRNWPEKTFNEISENLDRIRIPIAKGDRQAGDIPYYGASGVVDHVADFLFDEDLLLVSEDGANLLARTYPIAFSISGRAWVNNHAHVLRFPDLDTQEYVRLYLNSISLEPFVSGMAQPKLNQAQLNRIPIPFPSAAERGEIVAKAELFAAETAGLQRLYEAAGNDLDDLRQSILQKAFAGELT